MDRAIAIVGAGPAGLSAAITVARAGGQAVVDERNDAVGERFHGDFEGIENWSTEADVLDEWAGMGIEPTFDHVPFRQFTILDPDGEPHTCISDKPLWYLVRRGPQEGTLDRSLQQQAEAAGVNIRFGTAREHLPGGGILALGPHRADAVAVGYIFTTDHPDGAWGALSDDLAPKGYAYLLVSGGRGTLASCMFADFHNEKRYLERTADFFQNKVGVAMREARPFGGFGNFFAAPHPRKGNLLYVGEAAGFQDALLRFGMRYAIVSGYLAARACLSGAPETYDDLWEDRLGGLLSLALVNRYLYERLGRRGYAALAHSVSRSRDVRGWLRRFYACGAMRSLFQPLAKWKLSRQSDSGICTMEGCDCTWCRCQRHVG